VPRAPDGPDLAPREALAEAERLLAAGLPFPAHDVLEAAWKAAPAEESALWRGLAQLAVGLTHVQRGNARGAVTLLRRGAGNVAAYAAAPPHGVPADALARWAGDLAATLEARGLDAPAPPRPALAGP
jgi:hypothetical protein